MRNRTAIGVVFGSAAFLILVGWLALGWLTSCNGGPFTPPVPEPTTTTVTLPAPEPATLPPLPSDQQ